MSLVEELSNSNIEKVINQNYYKYDNFDIIENKKLLEDLKDEIINTCGENIYDLLTSLVFEYHQYRLDYKKIKALQTFSLVNFRPQLDEKDQEIYKEFCKTIKPKKNREPINTTDFDTQKYLIKLYVDKYYYHDMTQEYSLDDFINECLVTLDHIIKIKDNYGRANYENKVFTKFSKEINRSLPRKKVNVDSIDDSLEDDSLIDISSLDEFIDREDIKQLINSELNKLNLRQQEVIKLNFGIGCEKQSIDEIAKIYSISRCRVNQLIIDGMKKIFNRNSINRKLKDDNLVKKEESIPDLPSKTNVIKYELDYDKLIKSNKLLIFIDYLKNLLNLAKVNISKEKIIHTINFSDYDITPDNETFDYFMNKDYLEGNNLNVEKYKEKYDQFINYLNTQLFEKLNLHLFNQIINDFGYLDYTGLNKFKNSINVIDNNKHDTFIQDQSKNYNVGIKQDVLNEISSLINEIPKNNNNKFLYLYDFNFGKYNSYFAKEDAFTNKKLTNINEYNNRVIIRLNILYNIVSRMDEKLMADYLMEIYNDLEKSNELKNSKSIH